MGAYTMPHSGRKPADLPAIFTDEIRFVINLRVAKALVWTYRRPHWPSPTGDRARLTGSGLTLRALGCFGGLGVLGGAASGMDVERGDALSNLARGDG
jgi:hypothetical protein